MKRVQLVPSLMTVMSGLHLFGASAQPVELLKKVAMPGIQKNFDHLTPDVKGNRLFIAAEWHSSVEVYDMKTGRLIKSIGGMRRPHAILYRDDLDRIYVTDGDDDGGMVRIYDAKTYQELKTVELRADTDSIGYDPDTKYLYVTNGGEDAKLEYSLLSIIDTTSGEKVGEIRIESDTIGGMRLERSSPKLYLDVPDKKSARKTVAVVDREKRKVIANWPIPESKREGALALDEADRRLFVGTIEGLVLVVDTDTGKEVARFHIGKGLDDLAYDPQSKRVYAPCEDGAIHIYVQIDPDHYKLLGTVASGPGARTGRLVHEMARYFTLVPAQGAVPAQLLMYEVH